jgi:O-antigen ligase
VGLQALERLFVVVLLLLSMQVEIGLTRPNEAEIDPSSISAPIHVLDTVIQTGVEALGALLLLLRWRTVVRGVRAAWPLALLAALALASTVWSGEPVVTLRRSALLCISTLFAIYLGTRYTLEKQAELLVQIFCLMMAAIVVLYFAAPRYVVDYVSHPGAWKGLSAYKNAFGQYMAIATLLLLLIRFRRNEWVRYLVVALAGVMLYKAKSAASLFCCVLVIAVMPLFRLARVKAKQKPAVYTAVALLLSGGMYLFTSHSGRIFDLLGRNATLSGRTGLWAAVWSAIMRRPLMGYGFDTFWANLSGAALDIRASAGWLAQRSDNGFLDLGLSLGLVGFLLFVLIFVVSLRNALDYFTSSEGEPLRLWPAVFLCFFLVNNMAESTLLTRGAFPSLLFAIIATSLFIESRRIAGGQTNEAAIPSPALDSQRSLESEFASVLQS